jgi:hypothetical protein
MSKQTRAGFLKSLLGIAVAPAIIAEVAAKPSVYDGEKIDRLKYDEVGQWAEPKSNTYYWFENNPMWRCGDIGKTDMGCLFRVMIVSFHTHKTEAMISVKPFEVGPGKELKYKNLRDGSVKLRSWVNEYKEAPHE